jgi:hypothetical protein
MGAAIDLDTLSGPSRVPVPASSDFDLNPGVVLPPGRKLRPAAVLIPVLGAEVILTKRASHLKHHPGQIALPGGKVDEATPMPPPPPARSAGGDRPRPRRTWTCLAELPTHETVTGYTITPVLARVRAEFQAIPEDGEVAEVFRVPLDFLMRPRVTGWKAAPGGGSGGTTTWRPMVPITSGARRRAS